MLLDIYVIRYICYCFFIFICSFSACKKQWKNSQEKKNALSQLKRRFLPHFYSNSSFKGIVVNRALPSLEIIP